MPNLLKNLRKGWLRERPIRRIKGRELAEKKQKEETLTRFRSSRLLYSWMTKTTKILMAQRKNFFLLSKRSLMILIHLTWIMNKTVMSKLISTKSMVNLILTPILRVQMSTRNQSQRWIERERLRLRSSKSRNLQRATVMRSSIASHHLKIIR